MLVRVGSGQESGHYNDNRRLTTEPQMGTGSS